MIHTDRSWFEQHKSANDVCRFLFDLHPNAVFALDAHGQLLDANQATTALIGYQMSEFLQKNWTELVAPHDLERVTEHFHQALAGQLQNCDCNVLHGEGNWLMLNITFVPMRVDGEVLGLYAVVRERAKVKMSGLHTERLAQLGSWEWDIATGALLWSDQMYRIFGLDPLRFEITPETFLQQVHPDDRARVRQCMEPDSERRTHDFEYRILCPDGTEKTVNQRAERVLNADGRTMLLIGVLQDITDRKRTQEALRRSEQSLSHAQAIALESEMRYRSLIKYNPDGVCAYDCNGYFVETNPEYERVVGYSFAELSQMNYQDILFPEDQEFGTRMFQQALRGELTEKVEMTLKHKDGHRVDVTLTVVPTVVNQQIVGFYSIVKDITEQKQTEELLRKSEKLSVVGQLAAGVAHEIRNPLTALKGFVQLMQAGVAENKKYLEIMASELNRIELIVSEFLVLAKPQAIRFRLQSIYEILRDVTALIDTQAILNNVQVVTDWEEEMPPIKCDPNQLKQVFINFLKNSIEAMPIGGLVQIQVRRMEQDRLMVRFIDQGSGISEELIGKLGEPFYSTKEKGTGLGLMVSKKIIELHHGELHIQSTLQVGTTIEVILPVSVCPN